LEWGRKVCHIFSPRRKIVLFFLAGHLHAGVSERLYSYFADSDKWEAFPDTKRALDQIKSAGLKLGAISNFDERLGTMIRACDYYKR
jgi:FMN phosphatase YigB (HAD superfamily)